MISIQYACHNAWHFNWKAQIVHPYLEFLKGILQETNIVCPEGIQSYSQKIVIGVSHHLLSISFRWHDHSQKVIGSLGADASPSGWRCTMLQHFALAEMQIVHFQLGKKNHRDTNGGVSLANVTSVCRIHSFISILDPENLARHLGCAKKCWKKSCTTWDVSKPVSSGKNLPSWLVQRIVFVSKKHVNSNNFILQPQQIILNHHVCVRAQFNPAIQSFQGTNWPNVELWSRQHFDLQVIGDLKL